MPRCGGTSLLLRLCVMYLAFSRADISQTPAPVQASPPEPQLPFTTQIKRTVVFIQTDCRHIVTAEEAADVNSPKKPTDSFFGTGFFVSIQDKRLPQGVFGYLITNHHVAQPGIENGHPCEVLDHFVRLNLKEKNQEGSSKLLPLGNNPGWKFPDNQAVDLAALPFLPDEHVFDFEAIPTGEMATQNTMTALSIAEGDSVVFCGLFIQYGGLTNGGLTRMEPIVRTGTLAMLPNELLSTTLGKPGRVYLAEAHVFGGNSGSPMFVNVGGIRENGISGIAYKLLGVVAGEIFENTKS